MNADSLPILYSFRRCPYAIRARLALWASGKTIVLREVALAAKPLAMLEASPKGTVPVLVLDQGKGRVIEESLDIMLWALMESDPFHWLQPTVFEALQLIKQCDEEFKPWLDRYKYPERYHNTAIEARAAAHPFLKILEDLLSATDGTFLYRQSPSLADMAIFPFVRQYAAIDAPWFAESPYPRLRAWLDALAGGDEFLTIMGKIKPWEPSDEPTIWGRHSG